MLTVDDYARIRLAHRDGMSIREIASTFHHSRRKVREMLAQPQPTPYTRTKPPPAPVLGSFHQAIDAILAADEGSDGVDSDPGRVCELPVALGVLTRMF